MAGSWFGRLLKTVVVGAGVGSWFLCHGRRDHPTLAVMRRYPYAHRGLHDNSTPENSLEGFHLAVEAGYGAEVDVHLTRDGRLAVIHDSELRRLCGVDARVEDLTAAEVGEMRLLDTSARIPFLEDILPLFEGTTPLIVEIKPERGNHAALTSAAVTCLDQFNVVYSIQSFDPRVLLWLRRNRPDVARGQLTQNFLRPDHPQLSLPVRVIMTALLSNALTRPDYVAMRFTDRRNLLHRMNTRWWGMQGAYWTITSPKDFRQAAKDNHMVIFEGFRPGTH